MTSVARTLLDLADVLTRPRLERAVESAERLRLFDLVELQRLLERGDGRRGLGDLQAMLTESHELVQLTRSELERRFLDHCREAGLPPPAVNVVVAGYEVDALWPRGLVVELDGYEFHSSRSAFEADRARDGALQLAGHKVLRVTARRLAAEPRAVTSTIRSLLSSSAADGSIR